MSLHYEVRGSGPVLLMTPGAPADAGMCEDLAGLLADRHTVVAFDLRGLSRSGLDGPPVDQRVHVQADDAQHLLAALGTEPGADQPQFEPSPEMMQMMARMGGNIDFFLTHVLRPVIGYEPDVEALRSGEPRVVVAVGAASHEGQVPYRTGVALAGRLGTDPVVFPGDHGGVGSHPAEFAERLHAVLRG